MITTKACAYVGPTEECHSICSADFATLVRLNNNTSSFLRLQISLGLKGLSREIYLKNVDENGQILALLRAAAGF